MNTKIILFGLFITLSVTTLLFSTYFIMQAIDTSNTIEHTKRVFLTSAISCLILTVALFVCYLVFGVVRGTLVRWIIFAFMLFIVSLAIWLVVFPKQRIHKGRTISKYITPEGPHQTEELVVAVCHEDVDWIDRYADKYKLVTIYKKCGRKLDFKSPNIKLVTSPNIGNCDHAYLTYIIDRYDTLPNLIEFTKGSEPPTGKYHNCLPCHAPQTLLDRSVSHDPSILMSYNQKQGHIFKNHPEMARKHPWINSEYANMGEWIDDSPYLNRRMYAQNMCNIIFGGHFGTTSEQIKRTPLKAYIALRSQQKFTREEVDHFIERTWRPLLCRPKYKLVVVAIFKNEAQGIREWLQHHIEQGVDHFYMINNDSTDNWESQVVDMPVTIYTDPEKYKQVQHYNDYFLDTVKTTAEWVMVIDIDEFVYVPKGKGKITDVLDKYDSSVGVIKMRWKMFGSNGHVVQPESIRGGFTTRKKMIAGPGAYGVVGNSVKRFGNFHETEIGSDQHVKSIVRTIVLIKFGIHVHETTPCSERIEPLEASEESLIDANLHLNHYAIQSYDWFTKVKMTRGDAHNIKSARIRNDQYFDDYNWKDVRDTDLAVLCGLIQDHDLKHYEIPNETLFYSDDEPSYILQGVDEAVNNKQWEYNEQKKRMLLIYAAHTNTVQKERATHRNFDMLSKSHGPFEVEYRVVDSDCCDRLVGVDWLPGPLTRIPNDGTLDTGKWLAVMEKEDLSRYDYVTLVNDSVVLLRPVSDYMYFVAASGGNSLCGLLASREITNHLQSWFRSVPRNLIERFHSFNKDRLTSASQGGQSQHIMKLEVGVCQLLPFKALYDTPRAVKAPETHPNVMFTDRELDVFIRERGFPALKLKKLNTHLIFSGRPSFLDKLLHEHGLNKRLERVQNSLIY